MSSHHDPTVGERLVHDLGLAPGLNAGIDEPLIEGLRRIDDEAFERAYRAHPERFVHRPVASEADLEQAIRERAHAIWEHEGRPHGEDEAIWLVAEKQIRTAERIKRESH
jgi:hypothetical protein